MQARVIKFAEWIAQHTSAMDYDGILACFHQGRKTVNDWTLYKGALVENWKVIPDSDVLSDHFIDNI